MKVGELRRVWDDEALRITAEHEVLVDVRMPDGSVVSCEVTGYRDTIIDGPETGEETFVLYAFPLQPDR